jgi:beta-mannanase
MNPPDSPSWSSFMGYKPDFTINNSYAGPGGGGSNACTQNGGYPTVVGNSTYDANSGMGDPNAAANGNYNAAYASLMANFYAPCASTIYALRLNWEWPGFWFDFSPSWSSGGQLPQSQWVSPATWIAGWQNFVNALRANPATAHIKVSWDYPTLQYGGAAALAYYPGDAYVDIISTDYYFNTQYDGATSAEAWNKAMSPGGLNDMATFAAAHNKPMAFWEWADMYNDGVLTTQFSNWMKAHNVVAHSYWDSNDALSSAARLQDNGARQAAYVAAWKNWVPSGTYWGSALPPIPAAGYPGF